MAQQEAAHHDDTSVQQAEEPTQSTTADGEDRQTQIRKLHNDESVCQAEEGPKNVSFQLLHETPYLCTSYGLSSQVFIPIAKRTRSKS